MMPAFQEKGLFMAALHGGRVGHHGRLALVAADGGLGDLDRTLLAICSCTDASFTLVIEP